MIDKRRHFSTFLFSCVFCSTFVFYLFTSAWDIVPSANGGELVSAGHTLGISHPTGYPAWTIILQSSTRLIPLSNVVHRANVVCALTGSLTLLFLFSLLSMLFQSKLSVLAVLAVLAIEPLFWFQSITTEVYGFHVFLTTVFLWSLIKGRNKSDARFFLLAVFVLSLALTNHLLSLFYVPLLILGRWKKTGLSLPDPRRVLHAGLILALLGLSAYIYLPIRARTNPSISWHQPDKFHTLISHVSGNQFHQLVTESPFHTALERLLSVPSTIQTPSRFIFFLLGTAGFLLFFRSRTLAKRDKLGFSIFLFGIIIFPLVYGIHDIDTYFLPLVITIHCFSILSLQRLNLIQGRRVLLVAMAALFCIAYGSIEARQELAKLQEPLLRNYAKILVSSVPERGHLFYQGDNAMNGISYLIAVERFREDVVFIDKNRNLKPIGPRDKSMRSGITAVSFRFSNEYGLFRPNGMAFITRSQSFYSPSLTELSERFLLRFTGGINRWNPSRNELVTQILINLAENKFEHENWHSGLQLLNDSIATAASNDTRRFIASLLAARGRLDRAIDLCEEILRDDADDAATSNNLAFYLYLSGSDLDRAEKNVQYARKSDPMNTSYLNTYYRILIGRGKLIEAEQLESTYGDRINLDLLREREALRFMAKTQDINPVTFSSKDFVDAFITRLYLSRALNHCRLMMIRRLQMEQLTEMDIRSFIDVSEKLGFSHAALYLLSTIPQINSVPRYRHFQDELNKKCFNFALLGDNEWPHSEAWTGASGRRTLL